MNNLLIVLQSAKSATICMEDNIIEDDSIQLWPHEGICTDFSDERADTLRKSLNPIYCFATNSP